MLLARALNQSPISERLSMEEVLDNSLDESIAKRTKKELIQMVYLNITNILMFRKQKLSNF